MSVKTGHVLIQELATLQPTWRYTWKTISESTIWSNVLSRPQQYWQNESISNTRFHNMFAQWSITWTSTC